MFPYAYNLLQHYLKSQAVISRFSLMEGWTSRRWGYVNDDIVLKGYNLIKEIKWGERDSVPIMHFTGICLKSQFDTCLISFAPFLYKRYVMLLLLLRFWMQRWLSHILKWTLSGKIQGISRGLATFSTFICLIFKLESFCLNEFVLFLQFIWRYIWLGSLYWCPPWWSVHSEGTS